MNTGAEGVETAIKITRKWGYQKKGVAANQAQIIVCNNNFHGRTSTIISFSTDPNSKGNFGPYATGFIHVPYDDLESLEAVLETNPNVVGFLVEPIQGEAGVYTPATDFIKGAQALCSEYNVLLIADEIQTGIGRTGSLLAVCGDCTCENACEQQSASYVRPDMLILGKAISGGMYPVSAVLCDADVMEVIQPGQHGSTFGGNPLAVTIAKKALEVVLNEKLAQNARRLGDIFRAEMNRYIVQSNIVQLVRGKGLLNAIVINDSPESDTAWNICLKLRDNGLLAKPTHGNIIRFAPPLVMNEEQLLDCVKIIVETLKTFENKL
jgi:ornithine--oxo-acid transaminase